MKKITLILLAFIATVNVAHSQYSKFSKKYRKPLHSVKNSGIVYTNIGDTVIDEAIKKSLQKYWTSTKVYFNKNDHSNFNINFNEHTYKIEQTSNNITSSYSFTNDYIYLISKENLSLGVENINILRTIYRKSVDSYGTGFDDLGSKETFKSSIIPYCIKSLNDCYQTIIDNPEIKDITKIYDKINEANTYKIKGKTILFLEDKNGYTKNGWINFKNFDKLGIKYKVVSFNEFKKFNKDELSKYVLVSYGRDPWMIFTLQDPITMDLLYINQYMNLGGSITKGRLKKIQSYLK